MDLIWKTKVHSDSEIIITASVPIGGMNLTAQIIQPSGSDISLLEILEVYTMDAPGYSTSSHVLYTKEFPSFSAANEEATELMKKLVAEKIPAIESSLESLKKFAYGA